MPSKVPFGPEVIVIQRHTQYSVQATDGQYYRPNDPYTLASFVDGQTYTVSGSVSAKGNKYVSKIEGAQPVAQPVAQPAGLPALPPAPPPAPVAPVPSAPVAPVLPAPPVATPTPQAPAPVAKKAPPPFKGDDVEGKVACALGAGLVQYLASVSQSEEDFLAKYQTLLPKLLDYHRSKGWT